MVGHSPRIIRTLRLGFAVVGCFGAFSGCKNREGGLFSGRDPLIGGEKIPPQGVPVTPRNAQNRDPLFKGTTASREPYRPGSDVTSAALAGIRPGDDTDTLRMDERKPATGTKSSVSPTASIPNGASADQMLDELRKIGGRVYAPVKLPGGDYEFRCALPRNDSGALTTFTGTGATQTGAIRDVFEQIRAEGKR